MGVCIAAALLASSAALSPAVGVAQTLDAPERVCLRDREIRVEWTGPDAAGDLITIGYPDSEPDVFIDSAPTADGSPAVLAVPLMPGRYEIRYLQRTPLDVLARRDIDVEECLLQSSSQSCPLPTYPPESFAVVVHGIQAESGTEFPAQQGFTLQQLCDVGDSLAPMVSELLSRVELPLNVPAEAIRNNVANQLQSARNEVCPAEDSGTQYFFTITYAHCRMAMDTIPYSMDIHLPPGSGEGSMSMADHGKREVTRLTLQRNIDAVTDFTGRGWGRGIEMTPTSRTGSHVGFATSEYDYEYTYGLGGAGGVPGLQTLGNLVTAKNEGTVWTTRCAPGIDIIQAFYENLTREVSTEQGASTFLSGIVGNNVAMLDYGLPLEIESTISSGIAGTTMVRGSSHAVITGFDVVPLPPAWCSASLMPGPDENYTFIDIDQQVSEALSGTGGQSAVPQESISAGLDQLNQALEQLTPEQREMLSNFGFGNLPQAPGAAPAAAGAAAGAAAAGTRPTSAELYSDDLTQMVQNHLQALGYDPGNTDGELTTATVIAISQFQAEKGLEVTGEVTPQLAGILAAEVDR